MCQMFYPHPRTGPDGRRVTHDYANGRVVVTLDEDGARAHTFLDGAEAAPGTRLP